MSWPVVQAATRGGSTRVVHLYVTMFDICVCFKTVSESDRELRVFEHLPGLLVGALLLQTLPLQVACLHLLEPARVIAPSPDQDAMSLVRIQED